MPVLMLMMLACSGARGRKLPAGAPDALRLGVSLLMLMMLAVGALGQEGSCSCS